jgi:hypothetical protein
VQHLRVALLICVCVLIPGLASADDGGWWDAIWKWDVRLTGFNTEFHLLCMDGAGRRVIGCEEWFRGFKQLLTGHEPTHDFRVIDDPKTKATVAIDSFQAIRHEIDLRVGYYGNFLFNDRYSEPEPSITGRINVVPVVLMYHYRLNRFVAAGGGMGLMSIYGDRFEPFTRSLLVPASFVISPRPGGDRWGAFTVTTEVRYIPQGFVAADFGDGPDPANPTKVVSNYVNHSEWAATVGFGVDLRRIGKIRQ